MKKGVFIFLCFILPGIDQLCVAQLPHKIDSLLQVLAGESKDTSKANTLNLLGKECYLKGNYIQSRKYSAEALSLSQKSAFTSGIVSAYLNTGVTYFYEGNYDEALKSYTAGLALSQKENYLIGLANCYNNMGLAHTYQRQYAEAIKLHESALKTFKVINDSGGIAKSYNNIGIIYEEQGNYPLAIKSYLQALKIAEARGDKKAIADAYFNIGNVCGYQNNSGDAIKNYSSALTLYEQIGFKHGMALCKVNIGLGYLMLDSLKLAMIFSQHAYEILEANGEKASAAQTKNQLGHIHTKLGNYSQAIYDFSTALNVFTNMQDTFNMSTSNRGIGDANFYKGQFNEALKYYNSSLALAKAVGFKSNVRDNYGSIAEVYAKKNDYENAYLNHKLYFALNDSLLNETKSGQITEMQTRYETEKKDNEIVLLNKEKEIQSVETKNQNLLKNSFLVVFAFAIVLLLFGYRAFRIRQALRLQDIRNKIAGDLHDDIGSTLNSISIYSEVAKKKDEQQDEALEMIGDASRKIIDAMSDIVWTVNPENDSFEKIIFRMKSLAYNLFRAKKIEFTFRADEILNTKKLTLEERRNIYLIFKEAINNLVKYAQATNASIILSGENNSVRLHIEDNGVGFNSSQEIIGNGLKNMNRRATEINAQFKIESSKGNGTKIELILKS